MSLQTLAPAKQTKQHMLRSVASHPVINKPTKRLACAHVTSRFATFYVENQDHQLRYWHSKPLDETLLKPVRDLKCSHPSVLTALLYGPEAYDARFFASLPLMMQYVIKMRHIEAREILRNLKRHHLIRMVDSYLMQVYFHTVTKDSALIKITNGLQCTDMTASQFNHRQLGITEAMLVRIFTKNKLFLHHPAIAGGKTHTK